MTVSAIIPSAGEGARMGKKKAFIRVLGKPILYHTVSVFEESEHIREIIIVVSSEDVEETNRLIEEYGFKKIKSIIEGGKERQVSVYNGLQSVSSGCEYVMVHDCVRPLVNRDIIASAVREVKVHKAVVVGVPSKDTVKLVADDGTVKETMERDSTWLIQTPQIFMYDIIKEAYERAKRIGYAATDDSRLVERLGQKVKVVMGSYENIKITTPEDLIFAEAVLRQRQK